MHIARLLTDHTKLRSLGADLVAIVSSSKPCNLAELARRRWDLARMVHLHLAYEERHVVSRLEADPRADVRAASARAKRSVEQLHGTYKAHVERWTTAELLEHWPEFQAAVRTLVSRMLIRIDHQETHLFPLVTRDGQADPAWQPGMRNWAGDGVALQPFIRAAGLERPPSFDTEKSLSASRV